jgi:hypothetical protein
LLFADVLVVMVYFVPAVRLIEGFQVATFSEISHVKVPVMGGMAEIAPSVADAFMASENVSLMSLLREMFFVPFDGSVLITTGGLSPVVNENTWGETMFMSS